MPEDALIVFTPSGRSGRFAKGMRVLTAARSLGVDIDSVCGGRGICGRCQVSVSDGEFAKFGLTSTAGHLSPFGDVEARFAEDKGLAPGRRLSCASLIAGDVVIDVPPESQLHKQIVRKRAEARAVEIDPVVRLHYVEVPEPSLGDPVSDLRRLQRALGTERDLPRLDCDLTLLHEVPMALRDGDWKVTVAVREGRRLIGIWPGFRDRAFGLAVDVGTTTIAALLCDLATGRVVASTGAMNPQIRFGEDVMSRLSYIHDNPRDAHEPTIVVRQAIRRLADESAAIAGIEPSDIVEATFVGNPIMHHILLGIDPRQLGRAPFTLVTESALTLKARDLDLGLHPGAHAYFRPCIAGHVGADTAGLLLSEAPHEAEDLMLIVDVGTNAEIVLGNRDRLCACSSPTGPAFEGAQISCGQRAAPGAIERVRIDRTTLAPRFKVIGCDRWSDEPDFDKAMGNIRVAGVCGSGIIEAVAEMYLAGIIGPGGEIDGACASSSPHVVEDGRAFAYRLHDGPPVLRITQADVRAIQLAKAALYAGTRLLMDRMGVAAVDRIVLAGAFGSYIDAKYAMVLGMIPDCDLNKVSSAGNAAGSGACIALLDRRSRDEIERVVRRVEKVEPSAEERFQEYFVAAMAIPHSSHPFPHLARAVPVPQALVASNA